jgi:hypothetical protein
LGDGAAIRGDARAANRRHRKYGAISGAAAEDALLTAAVQG